MATANLTITTDDGQVISLSFKLQELSITKPPKVERPAGSYQVPDCPLREIYRLYHEKLPMLPKVLVADKVRAGYIRARWAEVCANDKLDTKGGLDFFDAYFQIVATTPFLVGGVTASPGRQPFKADLEWLMRPTNFRKVLERKYEDEA